MSIPKISDSATPVTSQMDEDPDFDNDYLLYPEMETEATTSLRQIPDPAATGLLNQETEEEDDNERDVSLLINLASYTLGMDS